MIIYLFIYLFFNNSFSNFCFKSLSCNMFIFSIVIPVYVLDISFICLFHLLLSYVKVNILLCIYFLYFTYLHNYKMMFVLFFLFMTYFFIIKDTQPCFSGVATTTVELPCKVLRFPLSESKLCYHSWSLLILNFPKTATD